MRFFIRRSVVDVSLGYFEDVVSLAAVGAVRVVIYKGVVFVNNFPVSVGLFFVYALLRFLKAGFEDY